jgi:hypothetical protein
MSDVSNINELRRRRIIERKRAIKQRSYDAKNDELYGIDTDALEHQAADVLTIIQNNIKTDE